MNFPTIAVIGAGNMGSSLIGGLINDQHPSDKIWASDVSEEKLIFLEQNFHIHTTSENSKAVEQADVVIFAVKPSMLQTVATDLRTVIQSNKPLIISIAAGIPETSLQEWVGGNTSIVRGMPNMPALIGCGATALYPNAFITDTQRNTAESILRAVGIVVWVSDEALMDVVTAVSGSGPAYFFLVMEAMQESAEEFGLSGEMARLLTMQTALGSAKMALESSSSLSELRKSVTSPGGTTEKAIQVLEEANIRGLFRKALQAAKIRSEELGKLIGK